MTCVDEVIIVGGGIGGTTLAHALDARGIGWQLYERGALPGEVGAGIGLWRNALCVFDRLGLGPAVRQLGRPLATVCAVTSEGDRLREFDATTLLPDIPDPLYVVMRSELHEVLVRGLDPARLHAGSSAQSIDSEAIVLQTGERISAQLVVGADGLGSVARQWLHGEQAPRFSGEVCWRGILSPRGGCEPCITEVHGHGRRFGVCPIDAERMYWWATIDERRLPAAFHRPSIFDALASRTSAEHKSLLTEQFAGWPLDIPSLLEQTDSAAIMGHRLADRPPTRPWSRDNVVLLGDAAHPTTPNLGQGGCTAVEDAWVLADCLTAHADLRTALETFESTRFHRCARIVKRSRMLGALGRLGPSPMRRVLRATTRLLPDAFARNMMLSEIKLDVTAKPVRR